MIWALQPQPGNHHLAVFCDDDAEYDEVAGWARRGGVLFDDQRAFLHEADCVKAHLFLRFWLPEPFCPRSSSTLRTSPRLSGSTRRAGTASTGPFTA